MTKLVNLSLYIVLGFFVLMADSCGKSPDTKSNFLTQNVVILVMDGPRYSETYGSPTGELIPNELALRSTGVFVENFVNSGYTQTTAGHTAIMTGVNQSINNGGSELPLFPSVFQAWRKKYKAGPTEAWVIASKDKLEVLADCQHSEWKHKYMPSTDCGNAGNGTGYRSDEVTFKRSLEIFNQYHPKLVLINFKEPDHSGHLNDWEAYRKGILKTDYYIGEIVKYLNSDIHYKNKTTVFITNDHGRHLDGISNGFAGHGDACYGCRKIGLVCFGPDFKTSLVSTKMRDQRDIASTIAEIYGLEMPFAQGISMFELFTK